MVLTCPQVCSKDFFLKTVPLFDGGDDVGMLISTPGCHNLNMPTDIFNHSNVHFWEYMQPGYDALSFISCTGTNFLASASRPPVSAGPCDLLETRLQVVGLWPYSVLIKACSEWPLATQPMQALPGRAKEFWRWPLHLPNMRA